MNPELGFEAVLTRLKEELGKNKDAEVASALGMKPQTLSNRKKTESIPYEEIIDRAVIDDLDVVFIFTGTRATRVPSSVAETDAPYDSEGQTVNADLLAKVISAVDQELASRELQISTQKKAELIAHLYDHFTSRGVVDEKKFARFMDLVLAR